MAVLSKKITHIVDLLVVLVNIAAGRGNYLLFWFFHTEKTSNVLVYVILIDILYLFLRKFNYKNKIAIPTCVILTALLLLYNSINVSFRGQNPSLYLLFIIVIILFSLILQKIISQILDNKIISHGQPIWEYSKGYVVLTMISILGVIVTFTLLEAGFNATYKLVEVDYLQSHTERNQMHYWVFFSMCHVAELIRVPFFQDFGQLNGLFHEPHIITLNVFPCLFLLLGFTKKRIHKWLLIGTIVLMILFTGSTTNILVTLICLVIYSFVNFRKHSIVVILDIALVVFLVYLYINNDDTLAQVVLDRMSSDNYSQQWSRDLLSFAFTPKSLFGTNFLNTSNVLNETSKEDVGYIAFILNLLFIILYARNIIKLSKLKEKIPMAVAFASLYYIVHSAKVGMTMYIQTLPIFLLFLQVLVVIIYGRIRIITQN